MISNNLNQLIAEALKAKDEVRLSTLRLLLSALNYEKIAKQHTLNEEEELAVVRREVKKRKDAIESLKQAEGKTTTSTTPLKDRINKEEGEIEILNVYLPPEMDEGELLGIVEEGVKTLNATSQKDIGKVIGYVMNKTKGSASGENVSRMVREKLAEGKE